MKNIRLKKRVLVTLSIVFIAFSLLISCEKKSHEHKFGEAVVTLSATCTKEGLREYTCSECGEKREETIPVLNHEVGKLEHKGNEFVLRCKMCNEVLLRETHSYGNWEEVTSLSLSSHGTETRLCSCGIIETRDIHNWITESIKEPSCADCGVITIKCTVCDEKKTEKLPLLEHDFILIAGDNLHYLLCSRCGDISNEQAHSWDKGVITIKPTCLEPGSITYTCELCGKTMSEIIPAEGHDFSFIESEEDAHYFVCPKCGERGEAIPHSFDVYLSSDKASLTHLLFCSCGATKEVACTGSNEYVNDEGGYHSQKCANVECTNLINKEECKGRSYVLVNDNETAVKKALCDKCHALYGEGEKLKSGDLVFFGTSLDGKSLEWRVIEQDGEKKLLSENILYTSPYGRNGKWEESTIKRELNNGSRLSFSTDEDALIKKGVDDTKVRLMTEEEVLSIALEDRVATFKTKPYFYWLESEEGVTSYYVSSYGAINSCYSLDIRGVRPIVELNN